MPRSPRDAHWRELDERLAHVIRDRDDEIAWLPAALRCRRPE
jgi:hypothetical protein